MSELPRSQALRCFIMVAREGTVSRAAALLNLTQPAVSLQLKGLEEATGLQLFNRTPSGFTLTEAGATLVEKNGLYAVVPTAVAGATNAAAGADTLLVAASPKAASENSTTTVMQTVLFIDSPCPRIDSSSPKRWAYTDGREL